MISIRGRALVVLFFGLAAFMLGWSPVCRGQDEAILRAVESGTLEFGKTLVALPKPSEEAAPVSPPASASSPIEGLIAINRREEQTITDRAYPLMAAKWPFNAVFVCWENPAEGDLTERGWVQDAAESTWARHSGLRFVGWIPCTPDTLGIRIRISDSGPHVKYLGKFIDGLHDGMVLNFTFASWSPSCQTMRQYCIKAIAVHEFGHAIGFAHEQNRPDTAGDCALERQGSDGDLLLTPWDPHSVMNYCNPKYNNDGQLSEFDVKAVQYVYGTPPLSWAPAGSGRPTGLSVVSWNRRGG